MKKQLTIAASWIAAAALFAGCAGNPSMENATEKLKEDRQITYSNLVDAETQKEVTDLLKAHGVTQEQTDTLISWADDFNTRVTSGKLSEGFHTMPENTGADYQGLIIQNNEAEDGWIYPEANCRLTSYLLMKNLIHTNGKSPDNDTFLMFDMEAIDTYEPFYLTKEERGNFTSLFGWVPVDASDKLEEHIQRIQNAWKEREIKVEGEGISLITVYLHSPLENVRFVGHTGVLIETEDGLMFVEKYGPQFPFQASKFQNREQLKQYLLGRADLYGDETELEPIIMENDQLLT